MQKIEPGTKVRVINSHHWLFDKVGHVVKMTLEGNIKKQMAGVAPTKSAGVPVDFGRSLHGWYDTPLQGERRAVTHDCDGALKRRTGYYLLARDVKIEDAPSDLSVSSDGIAAPRGRG